MGDAVVAPPINLELLAQVPKEVVAVEDMYREPIAKKQAEEFCATIKTGQSIDGLAERAVASDAAARFAKRGDFVV